MHPLPPNYWQEVRANTEILLKGVTPEYFNNRPIIDQEVRTHAWPGVGQEQVTFRSKTTRFLFIGNLPVSTGTTYFVDTQDTGSGISRSIGFDPYTEKILRVQHGVTQYKKPQGSVPKQVAELVRSYWDYSRKKRRGYWEPRPRDYERLHQELGRGILYLDDS